MIDAALRYSKDASKKTKWILTRAAGEIPMLRASVYLSDFSGNVHASQGRRSKLGISAAFNGKTRAVSSIFLDLENPRFGYGDLRGTADLLLFRFSNDRTELEVFLLEGRKGLADILLARLVDGQLEEAIRAGWERNGQHNNPTEV
jgi:hypothetical protein